MGQIVQVSSQICGVSITRNRTGLVEQNNLEYKIGNIHTTSILKQHAIHKLQLFYKVKLGISASGRYVVTSRTLPGGGWVGDACSTDHRSCLSARSAYVALIRVQRLNQQLYIRLCASLRVNLFVNNLPLMSQLRSNSFKLYRIFIIRVVHDLDTSSGVGTIYWRAAFSSIDRILLAVHCPILIIMLRYTRNFIGC